MESETNAMNLLMIHKGSILIIDKSVQGRGGNIVVVGMMKNSKPGRYWPLVKKILHQWKGKGKNDRDKRGSNDLECGNGSVLFINRIQKSCSLWKTVSIFIPPEDACFARKVKIIDTRTVRST